MARNEDKSGRTLLSKVVSFVANPTTDWSALDDPEQPSQRGGESGQALKELIARKRRNDFVRQREFDALRKLLPRHGGRVTSTSRPTGEDAARASERQETIDKINLLEQQMSRNWNERQGGPAPTLGESTTVPMMGPTAATDLPGSASEVSGAPLEPDAELEEIAIRYANGDFEGAQQALKAQFAKQESARAERDLWLMLFDLYRATGQIDEFMHAAGEFAERFERSAPQWESGATTISGLDRGDWLADHAQPDPEGADSLAWHAPVVLRTQDVAELESRLPPGVGRWKLDWRELESVDPEALPAFAALCARWAEESTEGMMLGAGHLRDLLALQTKIEQPEVDAAWWLARLALLRVLDRADEFDQAALAYCITYEVSPPPWIGPVGHVETPGDATDHREEHAVAVEMFAPTDVIGTAPTRFATVQSGNETQQFELRGEILNDGEAVFGALPLSDDVRTIRLECRRLQRVDFAAASDLLNWVLTQRSAGRTVIFDGVNRLVALFFGVIGIDAQATVIARAD